MEQIAAWVAEHPSWRYGNGIVDWRHLVVQGPFGRGRVECAGGCGLFCHEQPEFAGFGCALCALRFFKVEVPGSKAKHGDRCERREAESFDAIDSDGVGQEGTFLCPVPVSPAIPPCRSVFSPLLLERLEATLGFKLP